MLGYEIDFFIAYATRGIPSAMLYEPNFGLYVGLIAIALGLHFAFYGGIVLGIRKHKNR